MVCCMLSALGCVDVSIIGALQPLRNRCLPLIVYGDYGFGLGWEQLVKVYTLTVDAFGCPPVPVFVQCVLYKLVFHSVARHNVALNTAVSDSRSFHGVPYLRLLACTVPAMYSSIRHNLTRTLHSYK